MSREGKIIPVEPTPASYDVLKDCARVLRAPAEILPVYAALGDHIGTARLRIDGPLGSTNRLTTNLGDGPAIEVPLVTIDALLSEHPHFAPRAIKIDVEGAELLVLRGACATAQRMRPVIIVELHWDGDYELTSARLLELSREYGDVLYDGSHRPVDVAGRLNHQPFVVMRPI
jgi:FkbM family methyltransferase